MVSNDSWAFAKMWKRKSASQPITGKLLSSSDLSMPNGQKATSPPPAPTIPGKDPSFGTNVVLKTFYEGKNSSAGYYDWVETPPKQLNKKIAKSYDRVAIKVYKIKDSEQPTISGRTALKYHMIEIQSPILVAALKDILKHENVFLEATEIARFQEPFKSLYFCCDKIVDLHRKSEENSLLKQHLELLLQVMSGLFGGFMTQLKHLRASGLISFKLAWTYFPKNSIVYSAARDCERLCKVIDTAYRNKPEPHMAIICQDISFDGEAFVWKPVELQVPAFPGNLPVTALPNYPLIFHEDQEGVKSRLTIRGKKILNYQQLTYCEYSGLGVHNKGCDVEKHNVSGRILIDAYGYNKHHLALQRREGKEVTEEDTSDSEDEDEKPSAEKSTYIKRLSDERQQKNKDEMLAREQDLILLSPILTGFALKNKLWLSFYVDDIKPVVWNDEAYDHLVYPEEQKDLVLTFVENHQRTKGVDDVIMGKGQGLILLLSGPPGTGKTLTAEAVADKTRRPLYYLQAEDLGTNAAYLGPKIKKVFEMATEWNAVILLDEADVFMAERSPADIARNELVSIFLRELEYFRGIIFLTTNLYSTIDTAFRSRVNIHLLFEPLPPASRLVLWRKFLDRLPMETGKVRPLEGLERGDLEELAKWELNGREIKNAIKTVKTWCDCKEYNMSLLRLESGIKVTAPQAKKAE